MKSLGWRVGPVWSARPLPLGARSGPRALAWGWAVLGLLLALGPSLAVTAWRSGQDLRWLNDVVDGWGLAPPTATWMPPLSAVPAGAPLWTWGVARLSRVGPVVPLLLIALVQALQVGAATGLISRALGVHGRRRGAQLVLALGGGLLAYAWSPGLNPCPPLLALATVAVWPSCGRAPLGPGLGAGRLSSGFPLRLAALFVLGGLWVLLSLQGALALAAGLALAVGEMLAGRGGARHAARPGSGLVQPALAVLALVVLAAGAASASALGPGTLRRDLAALMIDAPFWQVTPQADARRLARLAPALLGLTILLGVARGGRGVERWLGLWLLGAALLLVLPPATPTALICMGPLLVGLVRRHARPLLGPWRVGVPRVGRALGLTASAACLGAGLGGLWLQPWPRLSPGPTAAWLTFPAHAPSDPHTLLSPPLGTLVSYTAATAHAGLPRGPRPARAGLDGALTRLRPADRAVLLSVLAGGPRVVTWLAEHQVARVGVLRGEPLDALLDTRPEWRRAWCDTTGVVYTRAQGAGPQGPTPDRSVACPTRPLPHHGWEPLGLSRLVASPYAQSWR